jgi:hypothetical protein
MKRSVKKVKKVKKYTKMKFQTFCWSLGTTSFRVKDLAFKLYKQLVILKELKAENAGKKWHELQEIYYDKMHKAGLATGDADRKEKDARQFTSSLVQMGLTDEERNPTEVGEKLIQIIESEVMARDNILKVSPEAYIFFKQMMKLRMDFNDKDYESFTIKPYMALIYMIYNLEYITYDELMYFVPLCRKTAEIQDTIEAIKKYRSGKIKIEDYLRNRIASMDNYKETLEYFINEDVGKPENFAKIGLGRKGPTYDRVYFYIYSAIDKYKSCKTSKTKLKTVEEIIKHLKNIKSGEIRKNWSEMLFGDSIPRKVDEETLAALDKAVLLKRQSEEKFKTEFFYFMHINKWIATLKDYFDLNKRFLSLTETIVFMDGKASLDIIPKAFFAPVLDKLIDDALNFTAQDAEQFKKNISIEEAYPYLSISEEALKTSISRLYPDYDMSKPASEYIHDKRMEKLNKIILDKFKAEDIIKILNWFKDRHDGDILKHFEDCDANVPTIFEYVVAIIWYLISERKVNILEALNLTLDVNLLPKEHAAGGMSDIVFKYKKYKSLPDHDLLLEVTLTEKDNQRRNEMEPVSRHLGQYRIRTNDDTYAVFVANYLDDNVLCDFRQKKNTPFYNSGKSIPGMKIIPLDLEFLEEIINKNMNYDKLYGIFESSYNNVITDGVRWYNEDLKNEFYKIQG